MFGPLVYGTYMATIDTFMLGLLKAIKLGWINTNLLFIPGIVYAIQPFIFFKALDVETMTVMNLLWDVLSDLLVTMTGLFFFKEQISHKKMLGVVAAFVAITLLA
jgi:multidrug transporter EmrE-like cation transporter